jgi:hypothetical protein
MPVHRRGLDVLKPRARPRRTARAVLVALVFAGCSSPQPYLNAGRLLTLPGMDGGSALEPSDASPFPDAGDDAGDAGFEDDGDAGDAVEGNAFLVVGTIGPVEEASTTAAFRRRADPRAPAAGH